MFKPFLISSLCFLICAQAKNEETALNGRMGNIESHAGSGQQINPMSEGSFLSLALTSPLSITQRQTFEKEGIQIRGEYQELYTLYVPWSALDLFSSFSNIKNIQSTAFPIPTHAPLVRTLADIGASYVHQHQSGFTGKGKIIADIDSGIDVLHPHFFFADGGRFKWMDSNENGRFDVGVDGVDFNSDGKITPNEHLEIAFGRAFEDPDSDRDFDTKKDWLYVDQNRDHQRNVGVEEGFTEEDLAYGEPIFVIEDVDGNGILDEDESLIRLGSSKIVKLITKTETYTRGKNLIFSPLDPAENDFSHGTAVASILVGGQYGFHNNVGLCPDSEIVMYRAESSDSIYAFDAVMDSIENKYDIILHEWTESIVSPIDGSGNYEALMQLARDAGIASVNPVGNLRKSGKHVQAMSDADESIVFIINEGFSEKPYVSLQISLFWRSTDEGQFSLVDPDGKTFDFNLDGKTKNAENLNWVTTFDESPRKTRQFRLHLWTNEGSVLTEGEWQLKVKGISGEYVARIADPHSGWAEGIRWKRPTLDRGSVVFPATADAAFGVAALDVSKSPGSVRDFSGRGPRIDGKAIVKIGAPDDPLSAFASTQKRRDVGLARTWFSTFGGTSGAAPHVAGAMILLQEAHPDLSVEDLEKRLLKNADTQGLDAQGELPNAHLGFGKLNIFRAIFEKEAPMNNHSPTALAEIIGGQVDARASFDSDEDRLQYRYDFNHDGVFEKDWSDDSVVDLGTSWTASDIIHVQVRDGQGLKSGVLVRGKNKQPKIEISEIQGGGFCQTRQAPGRSWLVLLCLSFLFALRKKRVAFIHP